MDAYLARELDDAVFSRWYVRHQEYWGELREYERTVKSLCDIPSDRLESMVLEHLDTCSHRLDAWLTSLAQRRLTEMRTLPSTSNQSGPGGEPDADTQPPTGIYIGSFGWVEDLRPRPKDEPLVSEGFIHAPSVNQAVTAAILRSGYLSEAAEPDVENKMAVNLSSRRVRMAEELIEGVRMGNDLGSLLGYQFERHLHESFEGDTELDSLIVPFRRAYPSHIAVDPSFSQSTERPRHVVDGLTLIQTVLTWIGKNPASTHTGKTVYQILNTDDNRFNGFPYFRAKRELQDTLLGLPDPKSVNAVLRGFDQLADALDAIGDLVLSEGVYQIVRGNHARAAAVMGALARGMAPPKAEVVRTPRSGVSVAHRILLAIQPIDARQFSPRIVTSSHLYQARRDVLPKAWAEIEMTARAAAEPSLNCWLGERLGDPRSIVARVPDSEMPLVSAAHLALQPIDLLAILGPGFEAGRSELAARILNLKEVRPKEVQAGASPPVLKVDFSPSREWNLDLRSFDQVSAMLEAAHDMIGHGRPASAQDLALADQAAVPAGTDVEELGVRVQDARQALMDLGIDILRLLTGDPNVKEDLIESADLSHLLVTEENRLLNAVGIDGKRHFVDLDGFLMMRDRIREVLLNAASFGIQGVLPPARYATASTNEEAEARTLLDSLQSACQSVTTRWRDAKARLGTRSDASEAPGTASIDALKIIFGKSFPALQHFTIDQGGEAADALLGAAARAPKDDPVLSGWLHGVAAVRDNAANLSQLSMLVEAFDCRAPEGLPIQLPHVEGEPWLGGSVPSDFELDAGRLSIAVFDSHLISAGGGSSCALMVDHWEELIPAREETTGVAFHYDQPDAMPPQCLLLAVPPVRGSWRWHDLLQTLHETLELSKSRAVELEHLQDDLYGQILPGVIGEIVPEAMKSTVSEITGSRVILDFGMNNPPPSTSATG